MAEAIMMPRQGLSVESCFLTEWKKDVGQEVKKGDVIFSFETDKSTFEKEAEVEGILLAKFFEEGDEVPVLTNVGVVGEEGEDIEQFRPGGETAADVEEVSEKEHEVEDGQEVKEEASEKEQAEESSDEAEVTAAQTDEKVDKISPRAKNRADKLNVIYSMAESTGPEGRIIERDIEKLHQQGPVFTSAAKELYQDKGVQLSSKQLQGQGSGPGGKITTDDLQAVIAGQAETAEKELTEDLAQTAEYQDIELSNIRKNIAQTMQQSLQNSAQLTLDTSFDASAILAYRKQVKEKAEELSIPDISLNAILVYAIARTLTDFDSLNAHFKGDKLRVFKDVNLGIAVDTDRGLMAPTLFKADKKSLAEISEEIKKLAAECREGSINPDYLQGASFTVTNLGTLGIEYFTPVINPPQTGILGINTIMQRIRKKGEGYENYPAMGLSLTFDHRALDGAPAARFLKQLCSGLENFQLLLGVN